MTNLSEVLQFLKDNKYLLIHRGTYYLSNSFQADTKELNTIEFTKNIINSIELLGPVDANAKLAEYNPPKDYRLYFIEFIQLSKVPVRIQLNNGQMFDANKYSEPAMKEFKRMIEKEHIDVRTLIRSTQLYYASKSDFKKKIGNYILDGDWRSDYTNLKLSMQAGEKQLKEHIKSETKPNEATKFRY